MLKPWANTGLARGEFGMMLSLYIGGLFHVIDADHDDVRGAAAPAAVST
jgi:hypothetical protein